jgi:hypothetical protein
MSPEGKARLKKAVAEKRKVLITLMLDSSPLILSSNLGLRQPETETTAIIKEQFVVVGVGLYITL